MLVRYDLYPQHTMTLSGEVRSRFRPRWMITTRFRASVRSFRNPLSNLHLYGWPYGTQWDRVRERPGLGRGSCLVSLILAFRGEPDHPHDPGRRFPPTVRRSFEAGHHANRRWSRRPCRTATTRFRPSGRRAQAADSSRTTATPARSTSTTSPTSTGVRLVAP